MHFPTIVVLTTLLGFSAAKKDPKVVCCKTGNAKVCTTTRKPLELTNSGVWDCSGQVKYEDTDAR
ncbi:hypothetical protein T440DRAFT_468966 [Plenodomus tracheiphilus IPT5]|uniref:Uncharacterized protein n=1 Tax=Plenodomus tracheiphilus IPT5 TaxID=1408161 RepID=A0A6A7B323_9PLEO|nr:hypothetical protein T440DRAFT_468966 [Plenodomus tracheiphilus IPT5]